MKHCGQVEKGCECVSGTHQVLCHQSAVALQKEPSSHRAAHTGCKFCKAGFVSLYMITSWLEFPDSTSIRVKVTSSYSLTAVAKCLRHPRLRRDSVSFSSCWPLRMNKDGCKEEICLDHHICPRRYVSPPQLTAIPWAYCFVNIAELYLSASQYFSRVQAFISNTSVPEQSSEELNSFKAPLSANHTGMKGYGKMQSKGAYMEWNFAKQ